MFLAGDHLWARISTKQYMYSFKWLALPSDKNIGNPYDMAHITWQVHSWTRIQVHLNFALIAERSLKHFIWSTVPSSIKQIESAQDDWHDSWRWLTISCVSRGSELNQCEPSVYSIDCMYIHVWKCNFRNLPIPIQGANEICIRFLTLSRRFISPTWPFNVFTVTTKNRVGLALSFIDANIIFLNEYELNSMN